MKRIPSIALVLLLAVIPAPGARAQDDARKIEKGQAVFAAQHCSMCHAVAGKGNPRTPLDNVGGTLKPEEIRKYIVTPTAVKADSKMKAYPSLPAADLDALVAYLSTLKKK